MNSRLIKILPILAVTSLIAGCPLEVIVTSGGDVKSASTTRDCAGGNTCQFDIADTSFTETFTAMPKPGYEFTKWQAGDVYQCGNSTDPECVISTVKYQGNTGVDNILASGNVVKLKPIFHIVQRMSTGYISGNQAVSGYFRQGNWNVSLLDIGSYKITVPGACDGRALPVPVVSGVCGELCDAYIVDMGCESNQDWYFVVKTVRLYAPANYQPFTFSFIDPLYPD